MLDLGFNAGGYFADTTGWAAAAMALFLAARFAALGRILATPSRSLVLTAGLLALFGLWTVLSGSWSGNHGRALLEFDRTLLYLLVLIAFGSIEQPRVALRFLPLGFAFAAVVLCGAGLWTKTLPGSWPFSLPDPSSRLGFPVTYSNGLGILAALGIVVSLHIASWERERPITRMLGAAAIPLLAATLVLTFSRGAILAGVLGLVVYCVFGRPRGLLTGLVASVPTVAVVSVAAYDAELLASRDPATAASISQGHGLARTVGLAMLGAAVLLGLAMRLERRWADVRVPKPPRSVLVVAVVVAVAAVGVVVGLLGARVVDSLNNDVVNVGAAEHEPTAATRDRLSDIGGQTRVQYWKVSLNAFADEPIIGTGVGTFAQRWDQHRPFAENVTEGHSIYLETLGELGIVGAGLIIAVLAMLVAPFVIQRRDQRPLQAVGLAAAIAWLVHAGIDWDWELPTLTVWLFAFGGCALAASPVRLSWPRRTSVPARIGLAAVCLLLAITPVTIAISQRDLDRSLAALERDDCAEATRLAQASHSALPTRSEPYEILAYCASRSGDGQDSISLMNSAIDRDPDDWRLYYGLAVVRAAAGEDPGAAAARALRLNPLEPLASFAVKRLARADPEQWQHRAQSAPLPF
jgi:O-antigen ligase